MRKWLRKNGSEMNRKARREKEESINPFKEILRTIKHFFPDLINQLREVKDDRNQSYIGYDACLILLMRLFGSVMGIKSMRNITEKFNRCECIENIKKILNDNTIEELPHYDTINNFLSQLEPSELKKVRHKLIVKLIRMKCFNNYQCKKRWLVSVDGTGLYVFKERHCEHCLTKTYNKGTKDEYTLYFHYVLEAKLTIGEMVFNIASEFIENPENLQKQSKNEEFDEKKKQDCELKAWYRMSEKLKKEYPRLPICLLFDSLYANQEVFKICEKNNWEYIVRFKEGSLKTVAKEFESLADYSDTTTTLKEDNISSTYRYVNEIDYEGHKINIVECKETTKNKIEGDSQTITFTFITSPGYKITKKNQVEMVLTGRKRWRIENQGFNEQKNHGYELTHTFSHNCTAMKNHYMLIQIAHMIRQLFEVGIKILKDYRKSLENISANLLESFRNTFLLQSDFDDISKKCQIRINDLLQ